MKLQRGAVFVRQGLHAVQKASALRFFGCAGESGGGITVSRRYDSLGRVIEEKETDGTDTTVNNYSYDVSGNRTEHKLTLSGEVRSWKSYTYDLLGRMKTVGERPILTEKYDYSYKIMIFTMGGYEEYARYSLSYVGDCGEYCCEFDTMAAFYWHDHENSAWYEISLNPEEPLCGEMYISSSGKMAGSIGYQDGSMICRAEEISDLSEIDPDAGTIYYVIDGTNNIRYTVFAQNNCYYLYPDSDGGFSIPTYIAGGEAEIVAEYTYDARGNILTETKENGITTYYTYNAAGLPKTVINKRGETVISGYTYAYMLDGNIKSITETSGKTVNYTYDGLGRLVKEEKLDNGTTGVISYIYDVNGNRTGKNENGIVTTYTYDANNRLISENCGGWLTTYSYDANGNRTGIFVNNNFAGTYSYDLFGKQTSYTANNIGYTYYTYRPDGLRHSVGSTKHIWDGSNIVAEKYGNSETYYTYGIGLIKSGEEYYVFNWHGDVVALTNLTGAITKTYEYDAFGVEDDIDENDPNPWRYCGEYYDKETKTLYLRARYYDIGTGSFTQEDPIKDGSNSYSYCMGSPVALTDPSGLRAYDIVGESSVDDKETSTEFPRREYAKPSRYIPIPRLSMTNAAYWLFLGSFYPVSKSVLALVNYKKNSKVDKGENSTRNRLINDQLSGDGKKLTTGDLFKYGFYNLSHNGCEAIAVHNAKVLANYDSTLSDTIFDFETSNAEVGYGALGSDPRLIGLVLLREKVDFDAIKSIDGIGKNGTYIISYWEEEGKIIHTITYKDGVFYNLRCNGSSTSFDNLTNLEKSKLYDGFIYGYIIYDNA